MLCSFGVGIGVDLSGVGWTIGLVVIAGFSVHDFVERKSKPW